MSIPNLLTYFRLLAVPALAAVLFAAPDSALMRSLTERATNRGQSTPSNCVIPFGSASRDGYLR